MHKLLKIITIFALLLFVITACDDSDTANTQGSDKPLVYASFYPMYDFALKAAGDPADVRCLIPDGTEPHDWEPSAKDIVELEKADLFIYSSDSFETWANQLLLGIKSEKLMVVETSQWPYAIGFAGDPQWRNRNPKRVRSDPHEWISPSAAQAQFSNICEALRLVDPENADQYTANEASWTEEFNQLDKEYSALRGLTKNKILVTHAAFGHLCDAYGLEQIAVTEGSPDVEPGPARMAEIISIARENGITTVFYEEISGDKLARAIAGEIGGKAVPLSPIEGLTDEQRKNGDDYFSVMRKNLDALREALM